VPAVALEQWLAEIDDPGELKVSLRVVAILAAEPARGRTPASLSLNDLLDDVALHRAAELDSDDTIRKALAAALSRETLVAARIGGDVRLLSNDERAREYLAETGSVPLTPAEIAGKGTGLATVPKAERPVPAIPLRDNIFSLYERHIGTFGHSMAEQLKAAEEEYPSSWIEDAFAIAAEQNKRSWSYINDKLKQWESERRQAVASALGGQRRERGQGNDYGKPRPDSAHNRRKPNLDDYRERYGRLPWESDDR